MIVRPGDHADEAILALLGHRPAVRGEWKEAQLDLATGLFRVIW